MDPKLACDRPILGRQPHLLDLDQGTNIEYHFTAFVRSSETPSGIVWTKGCRFDWPRSMFSWNLVDLKRVCWEGSELKPGKNQLEFDFKYDGLGAAMMTFGDYSDGAHPFIYPGVW